ncbi:MAG: AraC family transcriptional regulator [Bacteroidales bacterium]|nr:AraC family transcriptional regulator [Bacteroidales bacterium]
MNQNEKLNQKQLDSRQMSRIDLSRTEWWGSFQEDIFILHNPSFKSGWEPYKLKQVLVVLCHQGNGYGAVNLRPIHLQKNSLLIALPSQIVESQKVDEDFKGTFLVLSERFLSRTNIGDAYLFLRNVQTNPVYQLDDNTASVFSSLTDLSCKLILSSNNKPGMEEIFGLIARLFYLLSCQIIDPSSPEKETGQRQGEVMMQFLQLLNLHCKEHREVGFYADKMSITAKYMTTLVKKASGKSALEWIEDYVILEAKAQLSSTVNTIQQIAFDLNFPSQSLFGRYFKRAVGMSPSDYRASLRIFQSKS